MPFMTVDVGGADLVVEIQTQNAARDVDDSGIDESTAYSGAPLVTVTYDVLEVWPLTTGPLTIDQYTALKAAAQYPATIQVSGDFARDAAAGAAPTINASVKVGRAEYLAIGGSGAFYYTAPVTVRRKY